VKAKSPGIRTWGFSGAEGPAEFPHLCAGEHGIGGVSARSKLPVYGITRVTPHPRLCGVSLCAIAHLRSSNLSPFFSAARQEFFRPDRRHFWPPRAAAVNDGPSWGHSKGLSLKAAKTGGRRLEEWIVPIDFIDDQKKPNFTGAFRV
jgi:hypothetical protein